MKQSKQEYLQVNQNENFRAAITMTAMNIRKN
jgi:hypothetical protein